MKHHRVVATRHGGPDVLGVKPNTLRDKMRKLGIPHGKNFKNKSNSG